MLIQKLIDKKLISPPKWISNNLCFLYIGGSQAYGTSQDIENKVSDWDIGGICIPPKEYIFPHLNGFIPGFGSSPPQFNEYEQHHIFDKDDNKEYDIKIMSIVKFFNLAMQGNPNVIEGLFVPDNCILHSTHIGSIIRENRHQFLSKLCWPKLKGYSFNQIKHMRNKEPIGNRKERVDKYGYDVKFAGHCIRLLNAAEMILTTHDLDLQANRQQNNAIRRGEWTEQEVYDYFSRKEKDLETVYSNSKLREKPNEAKLKSILMDCLEAHYGSLEKAVVRQDESQVALRDIEQIILKYRENNKL